MGTFSPYIIHVSNVHSLYHTYILWTTMQLLLWPNLLATLTNFTAKCHGHTVTYCTRLAVLRSENNEMDKIHIFCDKLVSR